MENGISSKKMPGTKNQQKMKKKPIEINYYIRSKILSESNLGVIVYSKLKYK